VLFLCVLLLCLEPGWLPDWLPAPFELVRFMTLTRAPLRNRTVDLLLTMNTISQPCNRRIRPDQAERWLTLAETGPGQPCPAAFCPLKCPPR
jgi:hypothetical protein